MKRGLPSLSTTTTATTSSAASSSGSITQSSGSTIVSSVVSGTESGTASSSTLSYNIPTITPPSSKGNPNIWSTDKPSGTIFIAVGSIVGAVFLAVLTWYLVSAYISRLQTQKLRHDSIDQQFRSHIDESFPGTSNAFESSKEFFDLEKSGPYKKSHSHSVIRLLGSENPDESYNRRSSQDSNSTIPQEMFSSIQDGNQMQNRRSLFISPTVEVINQQRKSRMMQNLNQSMSSLVSGLEPGPELNKPERAASPERKKDSWIKNQSSRAQSSSPTRRLKADRKKTPSMYLEELLQDDT